MTIIHVEKWCVYAHYVDGRCIYVGMGRPQRAFDCRKRSAQWLLLVKDGHDVEFLSWHDTAEDALTRETRAICEIRPICNKMHNGWVPEALKKNWAHGARGVMADHVRASIGAGQRLSWASGKRRALAVANRRVAVVRQDTGDRFATMTAAAASIGVSVAAVSFAVANGREVAGLRFAREARS